MRRLSVFLFFISIIIFQSCKKTGYPATPAPVPDQSYKESFDTLAQAYIRGWRFINHSFPIGTDTWLNNLAFPVYSGKSYIYCGYSAGDNIATISVWAISPVVTMQNGDKIIFYSRSINDNSSPPVYPDRLQVYMSASEDVNVGEVTDPMATGVFSTTLLDINAYYADAFPLAYPDNWTRFEVTIFGLSKPVKGRFAFRYFVEDGGNNGANSNGIGIDDLTYVSVNH